LPGVHGDRRERARQAASLRVSLLTLYQTDVCLLPDRERCLYVKRIEEGQVMDMKLEVVVVPVADVDKAKDFYQALEAARDELISRLPGR
jgi:hypothetical protein